MSYTLERFGAITLPLYNRKSDQSLAAPKAVVVPTIAGAFDAWGTARAPQKFPHGLAMDCILSEDLAATYRTNIDALRAAVGTRANLYRRADDDLTTQQCTARLLAMDYQREIKNNRHQQLKLQFAQLGPWRGKRTEDWTFDDGHYFDDGLYFDTGGIALVPGANIVTLGGNLAVTNAIVTLTINKAIDAEVRLASTAAGIDWSVAGLWTLNDVIIVDCGARSVTLNGADAYAALLLESGHTNEHWLELLPGANTIDITIIGVAPDISIELTYAEQWA